MTPAFLDINDCNLQLWHGETHVQSPGYALYRDGQYIFGGPARAAARVRPLDINTRYWWQLGTDTLQPALGPARHTADLAHAHLNQLYTEARQPAEIVLSVPGSMQREQLSLLLGIAQECPFDAVGLVHRSVALGSLHSGGEPLWHLEIQLHQSLLNRLECGGANLELARTLPLPGCGLLQLQERLVDTIAKAFVRQTRFDPRRKADTEQALYDALPAALRALRSEAEINIEVNGYRARISGRDLLDAGQWLFDSARESLPAGSGDTLLADPVAALLPGLDTAFPEVVVAADDDLREALQAHLDRLLQRARNLSFVTALPCLGASAPRASEPAAEPAQAQPTHLLRGAVASPLDPAGSAVAGGREIFRDAGGWHLRGGAASVNGTAYAPKRPLAAGDTLSIDGEELTLIAVRDAGDQQ